MSAHGPTTLWYATRGTGAIALVLLTASLVLGIGEARAWRPVGAPRFAVAALHRTISLLAVTFLAVHVTTTLLDPFPRIGALNALVPFQTSYRPLWLGLGTVASDLIVALAVTSLIRRRLGYRAWHGVHWLAYASWPVALVHGIGAGSDIKSAWMLALTLACVAAVWAALIARLAAPETPARVRIAGVATAVVAALALGVWVPQGPLGDGWARRAGTPTGVLAAFSPPRHAHRPPTDPLARPFSSNVTGRIDSGMSATGVAVTDLRLRLERAPRARLRIRLGGRPAPGGGVRMDASTVTLGPPRDPVRYSGRVESLEGNRLSSLVGADNGRAVRLRIELALDGNTVSGHVEGTPVHP